MADVVVKTKPISRDKLATFLGNQELIKAFENLADDVSTALPTAVNKNSSGVSNAQASAASAAASASAAQASANAAQADANSLKTPQYLVLTTSPVLTGERVFAVDPLALKTNDGGAGAAFTVSSADLIAILPGDVTDTTAAFVNATGLALTLVANATYIVDGLITFQSAAVTTGLALGFTIPAAATMSGGYSHNTTATAIEGSYNNASGAVKGNTSGVLTALDNVPITGRWIIKTGATAGSAQLQFRTEVATSGVTLKAGLSVLIARRIA